jgi:hypothetical protein
MGLVVSTPLSERSYLVGSAEQSFIQMMLDGDLKPGCYMAVTPCWRDDELDELHQRYFMKVELIDYMPYDSFLASPYMACMAEHFFNKIMGIEAKYAWIQDGQRTEEFPNDLIGEQCDIVHDGIELGSYGIRGFEFDGRKHIWVYGTGCAEPRLSYVLEKAGK